MNYLSKKEKEKLNDIIHDLKVIFEKKRIKPSEIDDLKFQLKSGEVFSYLNVLRSGSKPETALREELLAGKRSVLGKFLFGEMKIPECKEIEGFIDYKLELEGAPPILFELKALFEPIFRKEKRSSRLQYFQHSELHWEDHKSQIEKYFRERKNEFLILTNLKEWYFFSKRSREPINTEPIEFEKFYEDFRRVGDLLDYLERLEVQSIKGELGERFFKSLKTWVSWLKSVEFVEKIPENEKLEIIIKLINKFIFIQTLDNHFVIDFQWIQNNWDDKVRKWQYVGKIKVLEEFFAEVNEWFFRYYDTELFRGNILNSIKKNDDNKNLFYDRLKKVLGVEFWQRAIGEEGIINYNYRLIDEDILGKSYETFLAKIRKERGIFYTPKYITRYIVENTVGKKFDEKIDKFEKALKKRDFDKAQRALKELVIISVLDPACGSGSFLIKAIRTIWKKYQKVINLLRQEEDKFEGFKGTLKISKKEEESLEGISKLKEILDYSDQGDLVSKIILRHIHGNDLDKKAIDIAKLNIWLEAIKLAPKEFRYDKIISGKGYALPDLEMNLSHGDSLVGLPKDQVKNYLQENHREELIVLTEMRKSYLKNPRKKEPISKITKTLSVLRNELDGKFREYLEENDLPEKIQDKTLPFYWPLQFWYAFTGSVEGFDVVIGNPPYLSADEMSKRLCSEQVDYLKEMHRRIIVKGSKPDMYLFFIDKGFNLSCGEFSYIVPNRIISNRVTTALREFILKNNYLTRLINFDPSIQIFDDPNVHPSLMFLSRHNEDTFYQANFIDKSAEDSLFKEGLDCISYDSCLRYSILFDQKTQLNIVEKISDFKKMRDISSIREGLRGVKITKEEYENKDNKEDYIPEFRGRNIRRYRVKGFKGYYYYSNDKREKDLEKYKKDGKLNNECIQLFEKLVLTELSERTRVALENKGWVAYGGVYFISEKECELPLKYLTFILNSRMFNYLYQLFFESGSWGGALKFRSEYLDELPIPSNESRLNLDENYPFYIRKFLDTIYKNFENLKVKLKNSERILSKILESDRRALQKGNRGNVWTLDVSFYPSQMKDLLHKNFSDFEFVGGSENPVIKIYGINGQKEKEIYKMEFVDRDLMQTVYLSLKELFDSRKKIKNLHDILSKTIVPVIQPNIWKNTQNILKEVKKRVKEWQEDNIEGKNIEPDVVRIENRIQEIDNEIDAHVFKLYGLDKEEIVAVLDSLETRESIKNNILEKFSDL